MELALKHPVTFNFIVQKQRVNLCVLRCWEDIIIAFYNFLDKTEAAGCMRFIFCTRLKFGGFEIGSKPFASDLKRLRFSRRKDSKLIKPEPAESLLIL